MLYGLAALFLGFEGRGLQGAALARGGLPLADIVEARDAQAAEAPFPRARARRCARAAAAGGGPRAGPRRPLAGDMK